MIYQARGAATENKMHVQIMKSLFHSICQILADQIFDSLIISGYTDSVGNEEYNLNLSVARANMIAKYLVGFGIDKDKLKIFGYGETRLLNNVEGDDPGNRRVEIEIIRKE